MRKPLTYTYQSQFLEMFGSISNPNYEITDLGSLVSVERGGSPRPISDFITDSEDGINWIKIGDSDDSMYITKTAEKIKPAGVTKSRRVYVGDLLLSNSMSFGRPYILKIDGCIHDGWLVLHYDKSIFNDIYLCSFLSQRETYIELAKLADGAVVSNLNKDIVKILPIIIAPIKKQEQFAEIVRQADKSKFDGFKSQFLEMFGNNPLWEYKPLKDIIHEDCQISYGIVQPGDDVEDGIPIVRPVDMTSNLYLGKNGLKKTSKNISDAYKRTILRGDEVLLCVRGTTGLVNLAENELKGCNVTRGITPLFFKENIDPRYIYCILMSPNAQQYIADHTHGSTLKGINMEDVRNLPIPMPPEGVQKQCVSILIQADKSKYYELN